MKYAIIENGKVVNVAESESALDDNWVQSDTAKEGQLYSGGVFSDPGKSAEEWKEVISQTRFAKETAGISVNGVNVKTDRESQSLITGAALAAIVDPDYVCSWKAGGGFVLLDAATIIAVATAIRTHVQACFNREAEIITALNNETFTESMLSDGWPS